MNKILELLKQEIDAANNTLKSEYASCYVSGLEKAIELIKVQAATEVVESSIKCDYKCPNNDSSYAQLIQNGYD